MTDEALEDALYDSQALRGFAGIDLNRGPGSGRDDGASAALSSLARAARIDQSAVDEVGAMLAQRGLLLRRGTIVDATIIAAPSSTKNSNKARDPQIDAPDQKGNGDTSG